MMFLDAPCFSWLHLPGEHGEQPAALAKAVKAAIRLTWGENITLEGPREEVGKVRAKLLELQEGPEAGG